MRRHHIQPWNWPAESEQMMLISCYLLQFYSSISTNTLFQGCLVSSNLFYLLLLDCWFMFSFIRIHDLSKIRNAGFFWMYNEATSFSNIAAFSVLFQAPPKFMVIWFFKWTDTAFWVFVSFWFVWFLLIYQDDQIIRSIPMIIWWSWGRKLFFIIVIKPDRQVKPDDQDAYS